MVTRRMIGALAVGVTAATLAPVPASAVLPVTSDAGAWETRITGTSSIMRVVPGTPPGMALVSEVDVVTLAAVTADGTLHSLGHGNPQYWLGAPDGPGPVLVANVWESSEGADLNADGDQDDFMVATSTGLGAFVSRFTGRTPFGLQCTHRFSADLAVACKSEAASGVDLDGDGTLGDQQLIFIHGNGAIEPTSNFVAGVSGARLLGDGSVQLGELRVWPDGTTAPINAPGLLVRAVSGTTQVGYAGTPAAVIAPVAGPATTLAQYTSVYQVGGHAWIQQPNESLCRVGEDTSLSCFGIHASRVEPFGDDAAVVFGETWPTPGSDHAWIVPAGGSPAAAAIPADTYATELHDGVALLGSSAPSPTSELQLVTTAGEVTPIQIPGSFDGHVVGLGADRSFVMLDEATNAAKSEGDDFNGDGDFDDTRAFLVSGATLIDVGTDLRPDLAGAVELGAGGAIATAIDERGVGDRNGDGDAVDLVAAIVDDDVVRTLGVAVGATSPPQVVAAAFVSTAPNRGVMFVSESAQASDLDGDGAADDLAVATFGETGTAPPRYVPVSPVRLLDTRLGSQVGYSGAEPVAGQTVEVVAPAGAAAVVLNVTGLDAVHEGFVTVFPCGEQRPDASSLNLSPGLITPNLTITKVGANGKVCIFTQQAANLIADVAGTFPV